MDVPPDNVQRWYAGGPATPVAPPSAAAASDESAEEVP
jgi:hypothetical protein